MRAGARRIGAGVVALVLVGVVVGVAGRQLGDGTTASVAPTAVDPVSLGFRPNGGLFDREQFEAAEAWLGWPITYTVQYGDRSSPSDMRGSIFGLMAGRRAELPDLSDRLTLVLSLPLGFGEVLGRADDPVATAAANLDAVAAGDYDNDYRAVARRLIEGGYGDAVIRLGYEFNGAWAPWSSRSNEERFIAAYRRVHGVLRAEAPDLRFAWTGMRAGWHEFAPAAWPGGDVVDVVGLDLYWREATWDQDEWDDEFRPLLDAHLAFARDEGKPVAFGEWAVANGDVPEYVAAMAAWFASLPVEGPGSLEYQAYFSPRAEYRIDQYPETEAVYRASFGLPEGS